MPLVIKAATAAARLIRYMGRAASWLLLAVMAVLLLDIAFRGAGLLNSIQLKELAWHFNGALFLLYLASAYLSDAHVRIELFSQYASPRRRAWLEIAGILLFLLPYSIAVTVFALDYALISLSYNEASASPSGLPARWLIKGFVALGFAALGLAALVKLVGASVFLQGDSATARQLGFHSSGRAEPSRA